MVVHEHDQLAHRRLVNPGGPSGIVGVNLEGQFSTLALEDKYVNRFIAKSSMTVLGWH